MEPNVTTRSRTPDGDANDSLSAPELQDLELDLANDAAFQEAADWIEHAPPAKKIARAVATRGSKRTPPSDEGSRPKRPRPPPKGSAEKAGMSSTNNSPAEVNSGQPCRAK